jgi:predicted O-methyltransferase YrrM
MPYVQPTGVAKIKLELRRRLTQLNQRVWKARYGLPEVTLESLNPAPAAEPPIMDNICMPPYFGPKDHDDYLPLMRIARGLNPRTIVELGTAHGNTVANLCRNCPGAHIVTVNAPMEEQTGKITTFDLTRERIGVVYRRHGFERRVTQIFANTLHMDLAPYVGSGRVDLAIVDACHDAPYVVNDFHKVIPFVRPGGVVLLHDTHPSMHKHLAGSYQGCMQLRREGYDIRHIEHTWWGVWVKPVDGQ